MIKNFILILIFMNLGLLIYFNADLILPNPAKAVTAEINPEKIKILTPQQIESLPKKSVETSSATPTENDTIPVNTQALTCYEWGVFSKARVTDAQIASSNIALQPLVIEQTTPDTKRFWVYKPPLKSAEAAQAKALELKALGIKDLFVVQDAKWKNAISFGIFEDEQLATKLFKELKAKGIKDIAKALHDQGKGYAHLLFKNIAAEKITELQKLKSDFPEANLQEVSCN